MFVGRRAELLALDAARRSLAQSKGAFILISGDAGIGKSRLLAQFLRGSGDGRARNIASAECFERGREPLGPIRACIAELQRSMSGEPLDPQVARGVAQLCSPRAGEEPQTAGPAALEKTEFFAALTAFLRAAAAKRATIVAIEDLHWADAATLDFLVFAAGKIAGSRLLVLATYRSDELEDGTPLSAALARIERERTVSRVELEPLPPADLRNLLLGAADGHPLPAPETLIDVAQRADGNPFFAEELLKSAIESRQRPSGRRLPLSIRAGILERLAKLSDAERRIIGHAAVLGYRFDPLALALTLECSVDDVLPALRHARDANLIVEDDGDPLRFRFRHALTRQAIYADLLRFDARRVHERILGALEAGSDPERHLEELAEHAYEAHDAGKTLRYNERAAERAIAMHALPEARVFLTRALAAVSDRAHEARLLARCGELAVLAGRTSDAVRYFESAQAVLTELGDIDGAAEMLRHLLIERANAGDARPYVGGENFLARYGDALGAAARDVLLTTMARVALFVMAREDSSRFLAGVASPHTLPPRVQYNYLGCGLDLAWCAGDLPAWREAARSFDDVVPRLPPYNALLAHYDIANLGMTLGENEIVERAFERAGDIEAQREFGSLRVYGAALRATYYFLRGALPRARVALESALGGSETKSAQMALAFIAPLLAAALDDETLFPAHLDDAYALALRDGANPDHVCVLGARAAYLHATGRTGAARSDLRTAIRSLDRALPSSAPVIIAAAELLPDAELDAVWRLADPANLLPANRAGNALAQLVAAILAERRGDIAAAAASGDAAASSYRDLGWPLLEARALRAAGRDAEAAAIYRAHGAAGELRRLAGHATENLPAAPDRPDSVGSLSERELAVAELVALGLTNAAIAEQLAVSVKTIEKQVSSIFVKLEIRSRAQIAALLARRQIGQRENPA